MIAPAVPEAEFMRMFEEHGAARLAKIIGVRERNIHKRRRNIEIKHNMRLRPADKSGRGGIAQVESIKHPARINFTIKDGYVLVGSDAHYWPGPPSTSHLAFVKFCIDFKPTVVVLNGDEMDCSTISRFQPIGWEKRPPLVEELEAAKVRLDEIHKASKNSHHVWNLGNHDGRFATRLAVQAPEYAKINGFHLKDHFPLWKPAWACWVNDDVVIKHRFRGGIHAARNNTLYAGKTMITGHLHSQKVQPFSDYNGTRWGVDTGCMAHPYADQFTDYTEDSPKDWREGFCLLTFKGGKLLDPELIRVWEPGTVCFRGSLIKV